VEYGYTYVRLQRGFAYLVAVIDWYSRRVLSWRISNSMDAAFCVDCLEDALREHGKPEVFNSDQGSQFTSEVFTGVLKREGITISMDGRGRAYDNIFVERLWRSVKHEDVYLNGYSAMGELMIGLTKYFAFYNAERAHQSLGNQTPHEVYRTSSGGGAMIVDKYRTKERLPVALRSSGTEFEEVRIESEPAIPNAKTGAAPSSCERSSAT
jgi:putative transposase